MAQRIFVSLQRAIESLRYSNFPRGERSSRWEMSDRSIFHTERRFRLGELLAGGGLDAVESERHYSGDNERQCPICGMIRFGNSISIAISAHTGPIIIIAIIIYYWYTYFSRTVELGDHMQANSTSSTTTTTATCRCPVSVSVRECVGVCTLIGYHTRIARRETHTHTRPTLIR